MNTENRPMPAIEILDTYFLDNRARLLEIASFLDRIDRAKNPEEGKANFRYKAFVKALKLVIDCGKDRTQNVQLLFSDLSTGPIDSAAGLKAFGAWEGTFREGH